MSLINEIFAYISGNGFAIISVVGLFITFAQAAVKLTPTKKDDTFIMRFAKAFDKITRFIPNAKKGGGKH